MVLTIVAIVVVFIVCAVIAYKAKASYPTFTDEQLLNQHLRFLDELESARKYIGATFFYEVEKGSPAQHELAMRGYDIKVLLVERAIANRETREINWNACKNAGRLTRPGIGYKSPS
jgi:hypothetical protein